jgi:hypothetical protein
MSENEMWLVFGISCKMYGDPKIDCLCLTQAEAQRKSNKLNEKARHYCYYVKKVRYNKEAGDE